MLSAVEDEEETPVFGAVESLQHTLMTNREWGNVMKNPVNEIESCWQGSHKSFDC